MQLSMASSGQNVILSAVHWGPKIKKKLQDMGLTPGVKIHVISTNAQGAFIVDIRGSRLVLGGALTEQILVEPVADENTVCQKIIGGK